MFLKTKGEKAKEKEGDDNNPCLYFFLSLFRRSYYIGRTITAQKNSAQYIDAMEPT